MLWSGCPIHLMMTCILQQLGNKQGLIETKQRENKNLYFSALSWTSCHFWTVTGDEKVILQEYSGLGEANRIIYNRNWPPFKDSFGKCLAGLH